MRLGRIGARSYRGVHPAVEWQADDGKPPARNWWRRLFLYQGAGGIVRTLVPPGATGPDRRLASYCQQCGAVLAHPVPGPVLPLSPDW